MAGTGRGATNDGSGSAGAEYGASWFISVQNSLPTHRLFVRFPVEAIVKKAESSHEKRWRAEDPTSMPPWAESIGAEPTPQSSAANFGDEAPRNHVLPDLLDGDVARGHGYPFSSARTAWVAELACAMAAMDACASIWDLVRLAASAATSVSRMRDSADEKLVISDCDRSMA